MGRRRAATGRGQEDHFQRLARLLDLESREEARRAAEQARRLSPADAEASGNSLIDLAVTDEDTGLGGRFLLELAKRAGRPLPWTRLDVGSPVVLAPDVSRPGESYPGVICRRSERSVGVALESLPETLADHRAWRIDLSSDEIATRRQKAALEQARLARGDRFAVLRDVLVGVRPPEFGRDSDMRPWIARSTRCNARRCSSPSPAATWP